MKPAKLYIFSGLPGAGKSTLAKELARRLHATYLRVDTLEQGLRDQCHFKDIGGEGYRISYLIAKDNLKIGNSVIADCVNPWELTRREWSHVATSLNLPYVNIEIICSDQQEHRDRVEKRKTDIANLKLPTWDEVVQRDYHNWGESRLVVDTAGKRIGDCAEELFAKISELSF